MLIGVISDTHDRLPTMRSALLMFKARRVEAVLHAGDFVAPFAAKLLVDPAVAPTEVPLYCIYGNNDGERAGLRKVLPQVIDGPWRGTLGGCVIAMHHWIEWFNPGETDGADIVISGHTHEVVNEKRDGVLYLNPGECCGWLSGRCTVALLDTERVEAQIVDVTEL
ncbi:MAG: YfcE family phosphodiesterase [Planctomycetes bacterium]|nr:YfcE family phosphodiesterase [Planctomycetota bacterium]